MAAFGSKLRTAQGNHLIFWCPGCNETHVVGYGAGVGPRWCWNGSGDKPTFTPSIKVTHDAHPDASEEFKEWRTARCCHSFVTDGRIQFLADCTHALAGQTVDLPDFPRHDWEDGD